MRTLIKGRKLIDGKGGSIDNGAVLVEDDRIIGAGAQDDFSVADDATTVIDAGDKTVMPGLIDSHIHLVDNGGPYSARDSRTDSDDRMRGDQLPGRVPVEEAVADRVVAVRIVPEA